MPQRIEVPEPGPDWEPTAQQLLKEVYTIVNRIDGRLDQIQIEINRLPLGRRFGPEDFRPGQLPPKGDMP
jgi:hypothetical protein